MTETIFVDTAGWIALLNSDDTLHQPAIREMQKLRDRQVVLVTTEFILLEVADALSSPHVRTKTVSFINGLRNTPLVKITPITPQLFAKAWELYSQRPDKDWGLTDCSSFVVMAEEKITLAFTSDKHFEQAGFSRLLYPPR
ncbi:MAG: PIN domain-containing protein [Chloroflexi bacterium]|nr:MAG: PIN domain-containing protein [Chloroflexota bacterium]